MPCGIAAPSAVSPRCASAAAKRSPRRGKSSANHAASGGCMKIQDARAVVTGGASGLGNAVVRHITAHGGKAVIIEVQEVRWRAAAAALGSTFVRCDVTSEAEVNAAMDSAHTRLAGLNL